MSYCIYIVKWELECFKKSEIPLATRYYWNSTSISPSLKDILKTQQKISFRTSLVVQRLRFHASNAGRLDLILGQESSTFQMVWQKQKKKKEHALRKT